MKNNTRTLITRPKEAEADSFIRVTNILNYPVAGLFDRHHLMAINQSIFCNASPSLGFNAGEFRKDHGPIRLKNRQLNGHPPGVAPYDVIYLSASDISKKLDAVLKSGIQTDRIYKLNTKELLAQHLSRLYAKLDFIHPFEEGNSRTLRAFVSLYARQVNFNLDWTPTNLNHITRDNLYMARDLAAIEAGHPGISKEWADKIPHDPDPRTRNPLHTEQYNLYANSYVPLKRHLDSQGISLASILESCLSEIPLHLRPRYPLTPRPQPTTLEQIASTVSRKLQR